MEKVIVAFENEKSCRRISDVLESSGVAACLLCRTGAEVKRLMGKRRIFAIVCGFKLSDCVAESLFEDLPDTTSMLMIATQNQLDMCDNEDIFKLPAPVSKGDLLTSVRILLHFGHRLERIVHQPRRTAEEQALLQQAKELLMERNCMTEEQAHRFLQKRSMESGIKLLQTARLVLEEYASV